MFKRAMIIVGVSILCCLPVYAQPIEQAAVGIEASIQEPVDVQVFAQESLANKMADAAVIQPEKNDMAKTTKVFDGMVSLDFRDADIKDVLRVLSYKSGVNIVAGPEVAGLVTIQLENVPWQRALDIVLQTYGYAYERRESIISVTTVENLKKRREDAVILSDQEPLVTKAFVLSFAKAANVLASIEKMKTERGSVNFDERTNSIIVRDTLSQVEMMEEIIKKLDSTTPQVLIEAKIIETTLGNAEKLGINWNLQASGKGSRWNSTFPLRRGNDGNFVMPIPVDSIDMESGLITYDAENLFTFGTLDFSALTALMQIIQTRSDTNTLSNPRIVTLDNQVAKIVVGTQYPFPQYTYNKESGEMQVSGWNYKDIGVIFEVTPHVNNEYMVTLDLKPTITAIIEDSTVTVEGTPVPQLTVREAQTTVMIKNGDTLVIGGLISNVKTDNESKVPILGDIPFLGRLFRHKSNARTKTDLLIFLTPHIITPEIGLKK
jgi:type IV pilus assembly protein PilQ